jgi:hypothetical protein
MPQVIHWLLLAAAVGVIVWSLVDLWRMEYTPRPFD